MKHKISQKAIIREMDATELTELLTTLKDQKLIEYVMKQLKQLSGKQTKTLEMITK